MIQLGALMIRRFRHAYRNRLTCCCQVVRGKSKGGFCNLCVFQAEAKENNTTSRPSRAHYDGQMPNPTPPSWILPSALEVGMPVGCVCSFFLLIAAFSVNALPALILDTTAWNPEIARGPQVPPLGL